MTLFKGVNDKQIFKIKKPILFLNCSSVFQPNIQIRAINKYTHEKL